jgi:hypothetical protein
VDVVERNEALHSLGCAQANEEARMHAPVMADEKYAGELERVEQGQYIARQALPPVAAGGRLGPAQTPQIWAEDTVAFSEMWDDVTPGVPMLRPPVKENERWASFSGYPDVRAQPGRLDDLMIDSRNNRQVVQHERTSLRPLLLPKSVESVGAIPTESTPSCCTAASAWMRACR